MENTSIAPCALHPTEKSRGICTRCGNYVCDQCTEAGVHAMCPTCRARTAIPFPFTREQWSTGGLIAHSYRCFKAQWGVLLGLCLFIGFTFFVVGAAQGGSQIAIFGISKSQQYPLPIDQLVVSSAISLVTTLAVTPLLVGFVRVCLDCLRARELKFSTLFAPYSQFMSLAILVTISSTFGFLMNLGLSRLFPQPSTFWDTAKAIGLAWLILVPVGAYVGLGLSFTYAVFADQPDVQLVAALKRSWQLVSGLRWRILWLSLVCGFLMAAGMMMCLLPALVTVPVASLTWTGCYLALTRSKTGLAEGANQPPARA